VESVGLVDFSYYLARHVSKPQTIRIWCKYNARYQIKADIKMIQKKQKKQKKAQ